MAEIKINNINIHYQIQGIGSPLVLLHGLGSSSRDWEMQIPIFSQYFQVITLDLRGHGQSEKPRTVYSIPQMAVDVAGFFQAIGIGPAAVVGLSMGGMVAYQFALDFPKDVRKLVIVNSVPEIVPRTIRQRLALWQRLAMMRWLGMERLSAWLGQRMFPKPEQRLLRKEFTCRFRQNDPEVYWRVFRGMIGWEVTPRLPELRCPVLILSGDRDYFPLQDQQYYSALIPQGQLMRVEDAGHAMPVEVPEVFNALVMKFLQEPG